MITKRSSYISTKRDSWVEVNLDSIERNIEELKKHIKPNVKILAVVKADSYGHGSVMICPNLIASGVDILGVASIDEGVQLRDAKFDVPILVLGAAPIWSFDYAAENNLSLSIFSDQHIEAARLAFEKTGKKTKAHIKLDTGMNRIGTMKSNAISFINKVKNSDFIELEGIFTHFANAEDKSLTDVQYKIFKEIIRSVDTQGLLVHCSNTAASLSFKDYEYNLVRLGIGIYGLLPELDASVKEFLELKQAVSLKGRITNIHETLENEGVSYGYSYKTDKKTKIATVPIGYADGVSRNLSNKIFGILNGKKIKQIGNITMDQMMFDITGIDAQEGDIITLLGESENGFISIDEWAKLLGTINYELTCRLKVRLSRVYTR